MHFTARSRSAFDSMSDPSEQPQADNCGAASARDGDRLSFAPETELTDRSEAATWKILIVDDEPEVHTVTQLALQDFSFEGRSLSFLSAYSGLEAQQLLQTHADIAVVFLDVVMETQRMGLELVRHIRNELDNQLIRIVLRTGQPGQDPEDRVVFEYDISDYKTKQELTRRRLWTTTITSLRTFSLLLHIHQSQQHLERMVRENARLYEQVDEYARTLEQKVSERTQELAEKNAQLEREINERRQIERELKKLNQELNRLVAVDGLTQLANRRHFDEYLQQEWGQAQRDRQAIALILCDVDYFKRYNDAYGHQAGDECLQRVATAIQDAVSPLNGLAARYGGEEFGAILTATSAATAEQTARNILTAVEALRISHSASQVSRYVTVSLGVSALVPTIHQTATDLIAAADAALYQAKHQGRNCLCVRFRD